MNSYDGFVEELSNLLETKIGDAIYKYLDVIDNKISSLLTHVSILAAVSMILFQSIEENFFLKILVGVEVVSYIVVALGCLFCINIIGPTNKHSGNDLYKYSMEAIQFRLKIYRICLYATKVLTVILLGLFIWKMQV